MLLRLLADLQLLNGEALTYFSLQPVWFNEMPMPKPGLFGLPHTLPSEYNWNLLHNAKWPTPSKVLVRKAAPLPVQRERRRPPRRPVC